MKQKLGFLCTVLLLSCLLAAPSFAEDAEEEVPVGTRLGSVYTTDIVTYIDGAPIASYNIGGTTVVSVSDLAGYGFQVEWDPETRWVTVTSAQRPERMPEPDITREVPGTVRGSYYATDIRVLFNGNELEHVYNIGGWMMIPLSEVGKVEMHGFILGNPNFLIGYSRSLCRTEWDGETRTVRFSSLHPGDPLEVNGLSCTVKTILPAFGTWSAGIVQYQLPSQVPGEDPVAHWDASACSCDFGELTSMSAVQDIFLDYRLSVEAGGLVLREPALDVYFLSQIVQGGGRVFQREGDHLTLRKHIMPQKDMYPGCALAYLSVPLRLERNGQVLQTELGGVPLFDLERPDLCLNVSELLEMIQ